MKKVYRRIKVDVSRQGKSHVIFARQNDIGVRNLIIELTDNGAPYNVGKGVTAAINFKRPDGLLGAIYGDVMPDGTIHMPIAQIMIKAAGTVECTVSLFEDKYNVLTSASFFIEVGEQIYSGDTMGDDPEYDLLQSIFIKLAGYEVSEEERVAAEKAREEAEAARVLAEEERKKAERESLGVMGATVLMASAWSADFTQSLTIPSLRKRDLVTFYPSTVEDRARLMNYGVFVYPDTEGESVTVSARGKPLADISLRYFITRGEIDGGES